jgi:hypothetical protein
MEIRMPVFNIATVNVEGTDLVMIILDAAFGAKSPQAQNEILMEFQNKAIAAGYKGHVIPVWSSAAGKINFMAPRNLHPFFNTITPQYIAEHFRKQLTW